MKYCYTTDSWLLLLMSKYTLFGLLTARGKGKNHCETGLSRYCSLALNHWNAVVWLFFSLRYCRILKDFKQYFLQTNWPYTELVHCGLRMPYGHIDVDSSCNDGNKPLPESILTYHQRCSVAFTLLSFYTKCSRYQFGKWAWKLPKLWPHLQGDNELSSAECY